VKNFSKNKQITVPEYMFKLAQVEDLFVDYADQLKEKLHIHGEIGLAEHIMHNYSSDVILSSNSLILMLREDEKDLSKFDIKLCSPSNKEEAMGYLTANIEQGYEAITILIDHKPMHIMCTFTENGHEFYLQETIDR